MAAWDVRLRSALYRCDYAAALAEARGLRSHADFDYLLIAQSANAGPGPGAEQYFRAVYELARSRFPADEEFHLRALGDIAVALGPVAEGIEAAQQANAGLDRVAAARELRVRARYRLGCLYRDAGKVAEAAMLLSDEPCEHLRSRVAALRDSGVAVRCSWSQEGQTFRVDVVLDLEAGEPELERLNHYDPRAGYDDYGFRCREHSALLLGAHPRAAGR